MREPFVSFLNVIANRILTEEVSRTQTLQTNEHIASATQAVAKWTKGLVAVGALTAGILVLQYFILKASDETYRITNRPYVFLQDISLAGDGKKWDFIPQWVNGGNITTKDMKMRINFVGLDAAPGVNPGFSRCDVISQPSAPIVLGPKQVSSVAFFNTPSETFVDFQKGDAIKKLYLWGRATYYDGFTSKQRITRFCFDIERILGNPTDSDANLRMLHTLCTEGNCTDDECDREDDRLPAPVCNPPYQRGY
jgi:hypothetical protein